MRWLHSCSLFHLSHSCYQSSFTHTSLASWSKVTRLKQNEPESILQWHQHNHFLNSWSRMFIIRTWVKGPNICIISRLVLIYTNEYENQIISSQLSSGDWRKKPKPKGRIFFFTFVKLMCHKKHCEKISMCPQSDFCTRTKTWLI